MSTPAQPPRRALIVIDVQNEYFDGGGLPVTAPRTHSSLPRITQAMDAARDAGVPVIVVQQTAPAGAPVFDRDSHGWALHPEVARRPHDHFIDKQWPSAFTGTDLADWLTAHAIDTLTVVGYMTHNCVASTIFEACHRGLQVEFLHDASGSLPYRNAAGETSGEEVHRAFSVVFHSRFAAVASTADWLRALAERQALARGSIVASSRLARADA